MSDKTPNMDSLQLFEGHQSESETIVGKSSINLKQLLGYLVVIVSLCFTLMLSVS